MEYLFCFIYIILFLFSIILMLQRQYKFSILFFMIFATGGMAILPSEAGFIKATHLTFLYIVVFLMKNKQLVKKSIIQRNDYRWLFSLSLFFLVSILVSIGYIGVPVKESIFTGLRYWLFLSLLTFIRLKDDDYIYIFRFVFIVTFVTSVVFLVQAFTGLRLLPSSSSMDNDSLKGLSAGGFYHFSNMPPFCIVLIPVSLFCKSLIPKRLRLLSPLVFFSALFVTMYRTHIVSMLLCVLIGAYFKGNIFNNKTIFILLFLGIVFGGAFKERILEGNDSVGDISAVVAGRIKEADYQAKDGMTLLYRFAWIAERYDYMKDKPVNLLFGLGMISDEKIQNRFYNFNFGQINKESGIMNQVGTPDIAWGNLLTRYGIIGSFLLMGLYFSMIIKTYNNRKCDMLNLSIVAYLISNLLASFSGATISDPMFWPPVFFLYAFAVKRQVLKCK